jgi:hypothetical protein
MKLLFKMLCDNEDSAGYTPDLVGESTKWAATVNTAQNRANYRKTLSGKILLRAPYIQGVSRL